MPEGSLPVSMTEDVRFFSTAAVRDWTSPVLVAVDEQAATKDMIKAKATKSLCRSINLLTMVIVLRKGPQNRNA